MNSLEELYINAWIPASYSEMRWLTSRRTLALGAGLPSAAGRGSVLRGTAGCLDTCPADSFPAKEVCDFSLTLRPTASPSPSQRRDVPASRAVSGQQSAGRPHLVWLLNHVVELLTWIPLLPIVFPRRF